MLEKPTDGGEATNGINIVELLPCEKRQVPRASRDEVKTQQSLQTDLVVGKQNQARLDVE